MPTNVEGTKFDGSTVCVKHGTGNLEKFVRSRYSSLWIKEDKKINPKKYSAPSKISDLIDSLPGKTFEKMSNSLSDDIDADVVQWLMDHDRVRHMLQDESEWESYREERAGDPEDLRFSYCKITEVATLLMQGMVSVDTIGLDQ